MRFGALPLADAEGAVVAHTHHLPGGVVRKGRPLDPEALGWLAAAGFTEVVAARLDPTDLDEDAAADQVARAVAGDGVRAAAARTGRANLHATAAGLAWIDEARVHAVNGVDPAVTLGTAWPWTPVSAGEMVATVKIIPYGVDRGVVERACAVGSAVRVAPFAPRRVGVVATELPRMSERVLATTLAAQRRRVEALGCAIERVDRCAHEVGSTARAVDAQLQTGVELVLVVSASAIVDPGDVVPSAVRAIGGEVVHLGLPVDPGNLTLYGRRGAAVVLGVPGCARSPKRSGFDQLLERVVAGVPTGAVDLQRMGVGGLLSEISDRPSPRARRSEVPRLGAVVLAAGFSSRMGENKLLADLDGRPLVTYAVDALLGAGIAPVVVVTASDAVARALGDRPVVHARNPAPEQGMSRSLAVGLAALDPAVDGFYVMLGDVPFVRPADVIALGRAFDPDGAPICAPVHERRRGHPVLWAARFREALARLDGDVGARSVLDAHAEQVVWVPVDNPGVHLDVDTPEALAQARRHGTKDPEAP